MYARGKEWPAALESFGQAVQLDPDNKQYQKTYGFALARAGRSEEAYAALAHCMGEAEAHTNVARMLKHLQQRDACQWHLQLALRANPGYAPARDLLAELNGPPPVAAAQPARPEEPAGAVQQVRYEEPAAPPAAKPVPPPSGLPPVLLGSSGPAPAAPIKVSLDGIE
jgi:hypothetical protein